jgi:hypothetical protein
MAWPISLQTGLKEWATVCRALETGRQMLLLRKGGIYESGGEFELENPQFLLFPTYLHQNRDMLKPEAQAGLATVTAEPNKIRLSAAGVATDIIRLARRGQMDAIEAEHIWAAPLIDMRFNYKPENPLYLLLVRAYRLAHPETIENTLAYAGCKSWVPLDSAIATDHSTPVLSDQEYEIGRQRILQAI